MKNNTKQIFLSAGIEEYIGNRIANSGENCGFEYNIKGSGLSIYISEPVELPLDLSINIIEFIRKFKTEGGGVIWKSCGDKKPEFSYSQEYSKLMCDILNFHFDEVITFIPKELWELYKSSNSYNEEESLYTLNEMARKAINNFINKSISHATFLQWPFYDKKVPPKIDSSRKMNPIHYIPFAKKDNVVGIVAGFVYPFDTFIPLSPKRHKCVCHRAIFTIFSTHRLPYSCHIAVQLNNVINGLSPELIYDEVGELGNIKYRFRPQLKLTEFIVQFLNILYENQITFNEGDFSPENNISYVDLGYDGLIRRYHKYVNINAEVYEYFSTLIYSNDYYQKKLRKYPVDRLHPIHKYDGYNSWEYLN